MQVEPLFYTHTDQVDLLESGRRRPTRLGRHRKTDIWMLRYNRSGRSSSSDRLCSPFNGSAASHNHFRDASFDSTCHTHRRTDPRPATSTELGGGYGKCLDWCHSWLMSRTTSFGRWGWIMSSGTRQSMTNFGKQLGFSVKMYSSQGPTPAGSRTPPCELSSFCLPNVAHFRNINEALSTVVHRYTPTKSRHCGYVFDHRLRSRL